MKKKSLFETIFYFLIQARSPSRICKGRDIAVILCEKDGVVDVFSLKLSILKKIGNAISWVLLIRPILRKKRLLQYTIKGDCCIFFLN